MRTQPLFVIVALLALAGIAAGALFVRVHKTKHKRPISKLAFVALLFITSSILFGDDRAVAYSLITVGIVLAVADIVVRARTDD